MTDKATELVERLRQAIIDAEECFPEREYAPVRVSDLRELEAKASLINEAVAKLTYARRTILDLIDDGGDFEDGRGTRCAASLTEALSQLKGKQQ